MPRTIRGRTPSAGTVLALIALFVALGGTAVAATGTLVNIADPTNPSFVAKVDSTGALKVQAAQRLTPPKGFLLSSSLYNYDTISSGYQWPFSPTTATIAIDHVTIAAWVADHQPRLVQIYYFTVPAGTTACTFNSLSDFRELGSWHVLDDQVTDDLPTPLVIKPNGTRPWCLATLSQSTPNNPYYAYLDMSGWVVSGTAPAGTGLSDASAAQPPQPNAPGQPPPAR